MSNADCKGRYPFEAICVHNICVPASSSTTCTTTTTTPPPPPPPHTTSTVTITVYPPPPPYHPTTVTVYECVTTTTSSQTTSTPSAEATLFPNLIVPIKQAEPNVAFGTQYTGLVSSTTANNNVDSLFAFDVPFIYETQNPTCQLTFTLPAPGTGFPRQVSGTGQVDVYALSSGNGIESATWNARPSRGEYLGRIQVIDGQVAKWIEQTGSVPCVGGTRIALEMVPVGEGVVEWFELKTPLTGLTVEVLA
jgi:Ubiquitin 3 binding protein But2 C-terminal domain